MRVSVRVCVCVRAYLFCSPAEPLFDRMLLMPITTPHRNAILQTGPTGTDIRTGYEWMNEWNSNRRGNTSNSTMGGWH